MVFELQYNAAAQLANDGKYRKSADAYKVLYEKMWKSQGTLRGLDRLIFARVVSGYASFFRLRQLTMTAQDEAFLKDAFRRTKTVDLRFHACEAAFALGRWYYDQGNREKAYKYYEKVIRTAQQMSKAELDREEFDQAGVLRKVAFINTMPGEALQDAIYNRDEMRKTAAGIPSQRDNLTPGSEVRTLVFGVGKYAKNPKACRDLLEKLTVNILGKRCDYCGKAAEREERFKYCQRCKCKYFCGRECQTLDWNVHKSRCREEWKAGDLVRGTGMAIEIESGAVLELVGECLPDGQWKVAVIGANGESAVAVQKGNLTRLMLKEDRGDAF
jgi:tetratricopeptide (TPR) repeat protein